MENVVIFSARKCRIKRMRQYICMQKNVKKKYSWRNLKLNAKKKKKDLRKL